LVGQHLFRPRFRRVRPKIDAEGAEQEVIAGLAGILARDKPVLRSNSIPLGWLSARTPSAGTAKHRWPDVACARASETGSVTAITTSARHRR
jgi:hypothetical protein